MIFFVRGLRVLGVRHDPAIDLVESAFPRLFLVPFPGSQRLGAEDLECLGDDFRVHEQQPEAGQLDDDLVEGRIVKAELFAVSRVKIVSRRRA